MDTTTVRLLFMYRLSLATLGSFLLSNLTNEACCCLVDTADLLGLASGPGGHCRFVCFVVQGADHFCCELLNHREVFFAVTTELGGQGFVRKFVVGVLVPPGAELAAFVHEVLQAGAVFLNDHFHLIFLFVLRLSM